MSAPIRFDLRRWPVAIGAVVLFRIFYGFVAYLSSFAERAFELPACTAILQTHHSILPPAIQRVLLDPWVRWDTCYYFDIAANGYDWSAGTVAFHPLYPMLVRAVSVLTGGDVALAMLVLGILIPAALCAVLTRYVSEVHEDAVLGNWVGWAAMLAPVSFVVFAFMTEGLFILLAVATLWALHRRKWLVAGALGCLATLTRQQGVVLMLPILWELWRLRKSTQLRWYDWGAWLIPAVGYVGVSAYRLFVLAPQTLDGGVSDRLKNALVSNQANHILEGQRFGWPWESTWIQINRAIEYPDLFYALLFDPVVGWAFVGVLVYGARFMTVSERLFSLGVVVAAICYVNGIIDPCVAFPRHILIAFPIFLVFGVLIQRAANRRLFVLIALLLNAVLLFTVVSARWVP